MTAEKVPGTVSTAEIHQFPQGPRLGLSGRALAKEIFRANSPEDFAKQLPAQSIYLAIRSVGLDSSVELLSLVTDEQYKALLDFDLWVSDRLAENHFWQWLQILDQEPNLEDISRFLRLVDARILGVLMSRYVKVLYLDEPTDVPPEPGFYTPDKGATWIKMLLPEGEQLRRFGKMLALIFEQEPGLFYQLLTESGYVTETELEEVAYQDRCRRLLDHGLPSEEASFRLNTPVTIEQLERLMAQDYDKRLPAAVTVLPLVFSLSNLEPLTSFLGDLYDHHQPDLEAELALLANAGVVFYDVDIAEPVDVSALVERIRGGINIGLERLHRSSRISPRDVFERFGLQKIYQLGLSELRELQRLGKGAASAQNDDPLLTAILEGVTARFPVVPSFVQPDGSIELDSGTVPTAGMKALVHLAQIEAIKKLLREHTVQ